MPDIEDDLEARLRVHLASDQRVARPGLADRIRRAHPTRPRAFARLLSVPGFAVVALPTALIVLLTLALVARPPHSRPLPPAAAASPSVSPEVVTSQLPPAGTDLFYYHRPGHCRDLVAVDWTGAEVGHVALDGRIGLMGETISDTGSCEPYRVDQNPNGSRLLFDLLFGPDHSVVLDPRTGGRQQGPGLSPIRDGFSDDSLHTCELEHLGDQGQQTELLVRDLDHWADAPRKVADVGQTVKQSGPIFLGCSHVADRAITAHVAVTQLTGFHMVQLSTGKVLADRVLSPPVLSAVLVSPRQDYIAMPGGTGEVNRITRALDGRLLTTLPGFNVEAFSDDGSRVLASRALGLEAFELQFIQWGAPGGPKALWTKKFTRHIGPLYVHARPGAADLAVAILDSYCDQTATPPPSGRCSDPGPEGEILLLHADGSEQEIVARAQPAWRG